MGKRDQFLETIGQGYQFKGAGMILGASMYEGHTNHLSLVRMPLSTLNRHGLIAGATGSGKTKTLQIIAEQLSANGVPSLVMDIKGDLSGIAAAGASNARIEERHDTIGIPFIPGKSPVEFLSLSNESGVRLRATVSEFGPVLLSKILGLNSTQSGILGVVFKYCDDHELPLLDLNDLKKVLSYLSTDGRAEIERDYGRISTVSVGAIMRQIISLEQQGAGSFFGELSFDPFDLVRFDQEGRGVISILRVTDIQDKPQLFSTFMLQLLAEIYAIFPEEGDVDKPKLMLFIDEAHLIFNEASKVLLNQIETIIKLIRSKGIGVIFVTQNPQDVPQSVLSQLGLKVQHALRAFTAKDRQAIRLASQNFPLTEFYKVDSLLTELGIGEALVTALDEKGRPTPLVHVLLRAPTSRMDILTPAEIQAINDRSTLKAKYAERLDQESAYDILTAKLEDAKSTQPQSSSRPTSRRTPPQRKEKSSLDKMVNSTTGRQVARTVAREITRGILGVLGVKQTARRSPARRRPF